MFRKTKLFDDTSNMSFVDYRSSITIKIDKLKHKIFFKDHTLNKNLGYQEYRNENLIKYMFKNKKVDTWEVLDERESKTQRYYYHWTSGGMDFLNNQQELNRILSQECNGSWKIEYQDERYNQQHFVIDESSWYQKKYSEFFSESTFKVAYKNKIETANISMQIQKFGIKAMTFMSLIWSYSNLKYFIFNNTSLEVNNISFFPFANAESTNVTHNSLLNEDDTFLIDPTTAGKQVNQHLFTLSNNSYFTAWDVFVGAPINYKILNAIYDQSGELIVKPYAIEETRETRFPIISCCYNNNSIYVESYITRDNSNLPYQAFLNSYQIKDGKSIGEPLRVYNDSIYHDQVYSIAKTGDKDLLMVGMAYSSPSLSVVYKSHAFVNNDELHIVSKDRVNADPSFSYAPVVTVIPSTGDYRVSYHVSWVDSGKARSQVHGVFYYKNGTIARPDFYVNYDLNYKQYFPSIASSNEGYTLITYSSSDYPADPRTVYHIVTGSYFNPDGSSKGSLFFHSAYAYIARVSDCTIPIVDDTFLTVWFTFNEQQQSGTYNGRFSRVSQPGFLIGKEFAITPSMSFSKTAPDYYIRQIVAQTTTDQCHYTVLYATEDRSKGSYSSIIGKKLSSRVCVFNVEDILAYKGKTVSFDHLTLNAPIYAYVDDNITLSFSTSPASLGNFFVLDSSQLIIQGNNTSRLQASGRLDNLNDMFANLKLLFNKSQNINGSFIITGDDKIMPSFTVKATANIVSIEPVLIQEQPITVIQGDSRSLLITSDYFKASIVGNEESNLIFNIIPPTEFCLFYLSDDKNQNPIYSFTQQDIKDFKISFKYMPAKQIPRYSVRVCNGDQIASRDCSTPRNGWIAASYNNPLIFEKNSITVTQGKKVVIDENNFNVTNRQDNSNYNKIRYDLKNVQYCLFQYYNNTPDAGLDYFYQEQINKKLIQFVDQGYTIPVFWIKASDEPYETEWIQPSISYIKANNPLPEDNSLYGWLIKNWGYLGSAGGFIAGIVPAIYQCYQKNQKFKSIQAAPITFAIETELLKKGGRTLGTNFNDKKAKQLEEFFNQSKTSISTVLRDYNIVNYTLEDMVKGVVDYCLDYKDVLFKRNATCGFFATYNLDFNQLKSNQRKMIMKLIEKKVDETVDLKDLKKKVSDNLNDFSIEPTESTRLLPRGRCSSQIV